MIRPRAKCVVNTPKISESVNPARVQEIATSSYMIQETAASSSGRGHTEGSKVSDKKETVSFDLKVPQPHKESETDVQMKQELKTTFIKKIKTEKVEQMPSDNIEERVGSASLEQGKNR